MTFVDGHVHRENVRSCHINKTGLPTKTAFVIEMDYFTFENLHALLERGIKSAVSEEDFPKLHSYSSLHEIVGLLNKEYFSFLRELQAADKKAEGETEE